MKITHVISDSNVGGAGILLSNILTLLKDRFKFEVILPSGSQLIQRLPEEGIKITEFQMAPDKSFAPLNIGRFYSYLSHNKPDILHTHASLTSRFAGKMLGIKHCISTRHCAASGNINKLPVLQRFIYNYCTDVTVCTANCVKGDLLRQGLLGKTVTITNGAFEPSFSTEARKNALLLDLGIPKGARIIGCCARLEHIKGQDLIIRIAPRILKEHPDVYFLFVGDGSLKTDYIRMASATGCRDRVKFSGYVSSPGEYQELFYVNVNSSRGTETSCLAISECMALGIPTVASDFGGNRELISDSVNGLIFEADNAPSLCDAILRVLSDDKLYKNLSSASKESYSDKFTAERMAEEYASFYSSLV